MTVINMKSVGVHRGDVALLRDINWEVHAREHWAVLGPNGSGKTTLLMLAAAMSHPSSGIVEVLGQRLGRVDVFTLRRQIGFASLRTVGLIPDRETVSNVVLTGKSAVFGRWREPYSAADQSRCASLLSQFGIADLADRRFVTLSEGERRRALIARTLMTQPQLLLLDEPTAGLDLGGREQLLDDLNELAATDLAPTSVLVTHHLEELPATTTHALLLREGAVVSQGPIAEVLTSAAATETFGLPVRVEQHRGRWTARSNP